MAVKKPDFTGWATRHDTLCSDGRTITKDAFKHLDQKKVPVMWQHRHDDPGNVLGHAILEHRDLGVYAYGYLNDNDTAQIAREMLRHGDINSLSIYANNLRERNSNVLHGDIQEVSLVIAGANPEAFIDYVSLSHGEDSNGEAVIYSGETLLHADTQEEEMDNENEDSQDESTVEDVLSGMSEEQLTVVHYLLGEAVTRATEDAIQHSDDEDYDEDYDEEEEDFEENVTFMHSTFNQEGDSEMSRNVFDQSTQTPQATLSHSQLEKIVSDAKRSGSFKEAFLAHAQEYGIEDIDFLFPDAKALTTSPEFIKRRTEWVNDVLSSVKKSPFSRVKTILADITAEEARARGYVKNTLKKEEVIKLLRRTTSPTTIYKKQKLDRDDMLDITDLDVVTWLKAEMRLMLDEEIARAILVGDGRSGIDDDHIQDPEGSTSGEGIRSILHDHEMYAEKVTVGSALTPGALVEAVLRARPKYNGSGTPAFYTTDATLTDMLLEKDKVGRRIYETEASLASALRVSKIVVVDVMKFYPTLLGIMVNLSDYTVGADKGGQVSMFDDFDIDYNQYKYLLEGRMSGGLTKPKSALVFSRTEADQVVPTMPGFASETNTITIPTVTGVDYMIDEEVVTGTVVIDENTTVDAVPQDGYVFPQNITTSWTFTYAEID